MRTKFKQWAVDLLRLHPEFVLDKIDLSNDFLKQPLSVEFGSGKGDFIIGFSSLYPNEHFLAVEKVETVAGMMGKKIMEKECKNVAIFPHDASIVLSELPDNYLDRIFLNFVDPWPKKKHAKRRLTFHTFLNQYYRILKDGCALYFKSDNKGLFDFTLEEIKETKFKLELVDENYILDASKDAESEYERKFRALNQPIYKIVLRK